MTKTPLQTLIDELEAKLKEFENNPMTKITAKNAIKFAITRAKQLLEVEKELLIKASVWGESEGFQECGVKPTVNHLVKMKEKATMQYNEKFKNS